MVRSPLSVQIPVRFVFSPSCDYCLLVTKSWFLDSTITVYYRPITLALRCWFISGATSLVITYVEPNSNLAKYRICNTSLISSVLLSFTPVTTDQQLYLSDPGHGINRAQSRDHFPALEHFDHIGAFSASFIIDIGRLRTRDSRYILHDYRLWFVRRYHCGSKIRKYHISSLETSIFVSGSYSRRNSSLSPAAPGHSCAKTGQSSGIRNLCGWYFARAARRTAARALLHRDYAQGGN